MQIDTLYRVETNTSPGENASHFVWKARPRRKGGRSRNPNRQQMKDELIGGDKGRALPVDTTVPRWLCQNCRNSLCIVGAEYYSDKFFSDPSRSGLVFPLPFLFKSEIPIKIFPNLLTESPFCIRCMISDVYIPIFFSCLCWTDSNPARNTFNLIF